MLFACVIALLVGGGFICSLLLTEFILWIFSTPHPKYKNRKGRPR
jgi:hypothetical protein